MDFSANLSLPYLLPNQAQKHVTMNESLRALDAIVQLSVISAVETSPPETPSDGDRYIVPAAGEVDWGGAAGHIAASQDGAWSFYAPRTGWMAWVETDTTLVTFDGTDWIEPFWSGSGSGPDRLGINATADALNRLAIRSNASLFSHDGAGHQLKINKAEVSDTASVLFQTNWSGRAEIGLTGSDDFLLKTSVDGETFEPALFAELSSGNVGIGTWSPTAKLHVNGAVRLGVATAQQLPDPESTGVGTLLFTQSADSSLELIYSDGADWRRVSTGDLVG